jgi:4-amino-4-deoxy-L-arabinose transferase-like glycosyltransferase
MTRHVRRIPVPLALLMVVGLAHALGWAVLTPTLNGPDEIAHAAYIQQLAETGHGPNRDHGAGSQSTQMSRLMFEGSFAPILGHPDGRPSDATVPALVTGLDELPPDQRSNGTGPNAVGNNPPLYYAYGAVVYRLVPGGSILDRLFAMRVATAILLPITVALVWLLLAELFTALWLRTAGAAVVALQPKLGYMAGVINPDMLLVLLSTATVLLAVQTVRRPLSLWRLAGLALSAGSTALTHGRGFAVLPVAAVAVGVALLRTGPAWRACLRGGATFVAALLLPLAIAFFYTRSHAGGGAFGGEVTQAAEQHFNLKQFLVNVWQFYLPKLGFMSDRIGPAYGYRQMYIETFYSGFNTFETFFSDSLLGYIQLAAGTGMLMLFGCTIAYWRAVQLRWREVLIVALSFVSLMALLHISSYRDLQVSSDPLITGRYLLPAIGAYAAAIAFVAWSLPRRVGPVLAGAVVGAHAMLCLGGLGLAIGRLYA